jgi:bifunctional non-homologous end joining protein LigD
MLHLRVQPLGFIEPCQLTTGLKPPIGPGWIHEIKHDGYRMLALRVGERVRLLARNGHDWGERFPAVVKALELLEVKSCLIDGERGLTPVRPVTPSCRRPDELFF